MPTARTQLMADAHPAIYEQDKPVMVVSPVIYQPNRAFCKSSSLQIMIVAGQLLQQPAI